MSVEECRFIEFPTRVDARGALTVAEEGAQLPFLVRRIYYLYGVSGGQSRGMHAHRALRQVFIAIHGSFSMVLDDGARRKTHHLSTADRGLFVGPMIWRELCEFSPDAVCLVLASAVFEESDYIRDYEEFKRSVAGGGR